MSVFRNLNFGTKRFLDFGVVLALMTALSVIVYSKIKHLIHSVHMVEHTYEVIRVAEGVQQSAEAFVTVMEHNWNKAREAVEKAGTAGTSLAAITSAVENIVAMNTSIAAATEEQSAVTEKINRSIIHIQQIAEETALGATQIAESSSGLNELGSQLQQVVDQFKV